MDAITIPILITIVLVVGVIIGYAAGSWRVYNLKKEILRLKKRLSAYE